jgi:hypothetical protein
MSEGAPGAKWDRCLARAVSYTAQGVAAGALASLIFFGRARPSLPRGHYVTAGGRVRRQGLARGLRPWVGGGHDAERVPV